MSNARPGNIAVFALGAIRGFGEEVAEKLDVALAEHEERSFEDGEHKTRPLVDVRDHDVYVLQALHAGPDDSVNDRLCRLLFFLGALRDADAGRVTAVLPYLCYARKDRKTKPRDPVTTRYVATLFESVGVDRVVTMDVHNLAAFQNAFRIPTIHLEARPLLADHILADLGPDARVAVISPDAGGAKRAEAFRETLALRFELDVTTAFLEKRRSWGEVSGGTLIGDVEAASAVIVDDLVSTGTTMARAARACREAGAANVLAAATHGLFVGNAEERLSEPALGNLIVADTVPPFRVSDAFLKERLRVVNTAGMFAETIRRLHAGCSIVELSEPTDTAPR